MKLSACAGTLTLCLYPLLAAAQYDKESEVAAPADDYGVGNRTWNGLSRFVELASGLGYELMAPDTLDWSEVQDSDALILVYPTRAIDPGQVAAFLHGGGRVVIADDFGTGSDIVARLGLLSDSEGVHGDRFHDGIPFAPIARPARAHPLTEGVEELIANHAAILPPADGYQTLFAFGPREGLVAAAAIGAGQLVVLSDPSVLINRMLEFPGNLQFALNLLVEVGSKSRRVFLLHGDFGVRGRPAYAERIGSDKDRVAGLLADFNRFLDELNEYVPTGAGVRLVAGGAVVAISLLLFAGLPFRRRYDPAGEWLAEDARARRGDPAAAVRAADQQRQGGNFVLPASTLRDAVNAALARILDLENPLYRHTASDLRQRVEVARGAAAGTALTVLLPHFRDLPDRERAASDESAASVSEQDFRTLSRRVDGLYRALGEPVA